MSSDRSGEISFGWALLRRSGKQAGADDLRCRELACVVGGRSVLQALTPADRAALMIPYQPRDGNPQFAPMDALAVDVQAYTGQPASGYYVVVECKDAALDDVFGRFCENVVARLAKGEGVLAALPASLRDFRRLLHERKDAGAGREKVVGLVGELLVLERLLRRHPDADRAWNGPAGSVHDFRLDARSIEVKTMLEGQGRCVRINGLEQLEPPPEGALCVVFCRIRHDQRGRSLRELLQDVCALASDGARVEQLAAEALDGADPKFAGETLRFALAEIDWYRVADGFPRLVRRSLRDDAHVGGISDVNYSLDLSAAATNLLVEVAVDAFVDGMFA